MFSFLVLVLLLSSTILFSAEGNLIENGSFEDGQPGASMILPGWMRRTAHNSFDFHSIAFEGAAEGKRCARILIPKDAPQNSAGYFSASKLRVEKGKCYRLSFKARCPEGNASARLVLYDHTNRYMGMGGIATVKVANSTEWQAFSYDYFTPDKDAEGYLLTLQLELHGPGEVFFDDVHLEQVQPAEVKTEFYPSSLNYGKKLTGIAGEPTPLIFYFFTTASRKGFRLELEAPSGFRPLFANVVYAAQTPAVQIEEIPCATEGRQRFRLVLPEAALQPMKRYANDLFSGLALLFDGTSGAGEQLQWELFQGEKRVDGGSFELEMLPALAGQLPKTPVVFSWYEPYLNYLRDTALLKRYIGKLNRSGVIGASISANPDKVPFNAAGFINQRGFWMQPPNHCLTELLENPSTTQRLEGMAQQLEGWENAILCWNYEPGLPEYYHFCSRCQTAFLKYAGLPPETQLTGDGHSIEERYPEQYLAFCCDQQHRIISQFAEICKKHRIRSGLNGYRVSRNTDKLMLKRQVGNLEEHLKMVDVYQAQIYSLPEDLWPRIQDMLAFHPETMITYTTDERGKGGTFPYSLLTPELVECEVMIAGLQRVKNLVLFVGFYTMDGGQINALRRALDRLAAREHLLDGEAQDMESFGAKDVHWREYRRDGATLLAVANCDSSRAQWSAVKFPADVVPVDPEKKVACRLDDEGRLAVRLAPSEVRFFELQKPEQARNLNVEEAAKPAMGLQARTLYSKDGWKLDEDAKGMITVKNPAGRQVQIDRATGAVLFNQSAYKNGNSGGWFRDLFRLPREAAWSPDCREMYDLTGVEKTADGICIGFRRQMTHWRLKGVELLKRYRFSSTSADITVDIAIRNNGEQPMKLAYWQHNRPAFSGLPVRFSNGVFELVVNQKSNDNNYLDNASASKTLTADGRFHFDMSVAPERFYFWKGSNQPVSCEMFFPEITLEPHGTWNLMTILQEIPAH